MKNKAAISVIVAIYNTAGYLGECLDSIIHQTYTDLEIILVDDGSTDESGNICDYYAAKDSRITVIHQINKGMVAARKAGLRAANGEYISFIDSDDFIEKDMYEKVITAIGDYEEVDCVVFGLQEVYTDYIVSKRNNIASGYYKEEQLHTMYSGIFCNGSFFEWGILPNWVTKVVRREVLLKSQYLNSEERVVYGEDAVGTLHVLSQAGNLLVLDICPYHYRQNNYINGLDTISVSQSDIRYLYAAVTAIIKAHWDYELFAKQVKLYLWFVILLRQYEKTMSDDYGYLFPFRGVKKASNVILYGAGQFGITMYKYIVKTGFCKLVSWVDKNAGQRDKRQLPVIRPDNLNQIECDYILITILNEEIAREIYDSLIEKQIDGNKIIWIDKQLLLQEDLPKWLEEN